ncbi:serine/threonine-protein kinase VRK1 [Ixodes scapularis]|uniref:serine/threonine-protein kinase VRK1 n=1 Tax=Ixodes scapularis TaxID=6945 RepID=UPI001A9E54EF|nr:serine/threonine-protein kinase VRK1 [Ixodes scapularis]
MPKRNASNGPPVPKKKGTGQARVGANGHRLPERLPAGEVLTDVTKRQWRLGKAVGLGGFGEIYLASDEVASAAGPDASYVIKIEPHSNGPLFTEMNFYHRVGKAEQIKAWVQKHKLDYLGMPQFFGTGSHEHKGVRYRFMVMERFGEDFQKVLDRNSKTLPLKTVFEVGLRVIDVLEYVHSFGYIHADVKASNLLLGFGKANENKVFLVDFGLASRYIQDGKHKECKEDLRFAHNGTIEFTSRDAHIGATSRRDDLEILGYNMLQWLCGALPWEDNLKDVNYVSQRKSWFMDNIPLLMSKCFPNKDVPCGITEYLQLVAELEFEAAPDYNRLRAILVKGIRASGLKHDGRLLLSPPRKSPPARSPVKRKPPVPKKRPRASPAAQLAESDDDDDKEEAPPPARARPANARARKPPNVASASNDDAPLAASPRGGRTRRQSAPSMSEDEPTPPPPTPPAATKRKPARGRKVTAGVGLATVSFSSDEEEATTARRPARSQKLMISNSSDDGNDFIFDWVPPKRRPAVERGGGRFCATEPDAAEARGARSKVAPGTPRGDRKVHRQNGFVEADDANFNTLGLDNPTPAMLELLKRRQEQQDECTVAATARSKRSSASPSPNLPSAAAAAPPLRNGHIVPETRDQKVQTTLTGPVSQRKPRKPLCSPASRNCVGKRDADDSEWLPGV